LRLIVWRGAIVAFSDGRSGERRRTTVPFTRIAIIRAHALNARDRPVSDIRGARLITA